MNRFRFGSLVVALLSSVAMADDTAELKRRLDAASRSITGKQYDLRYKLQQGETFRWKVVHRATTRTKIQGNTQNSQSRSISTKNWQISRVASNGNITFIHMVEDVDMWQKISDREEIRYNSKTDKKPPLIYEGVAETVGVPLATVTITPRGEVVERNSKLPNTKSGLGTIATPLPPGPAKIGTTWYLPSTVAVRLKDNRVKKVKIRQKYTLADVKDGVAHISVETEVLSVVGDPAERAQLVQQLTEGQVRFDIEKGCVISKQMDWDETVISFQGGDSIMQYVAQFKEELLPPHGRTAKKPAGPQPPSQQ